MDEKENILARCKCTSEVERKREQEEGGGGDGVLCITVVLASTRVQHVYYAHNNSTSSYVTTSYSRV